MEGRGLASELLYLPDKPAGVRGVAESLRCAMADDFLTARRNGELPRADLDKVPAQTLGPLVSILIPCCGMLEYTKLLVPSILKNTRPPYELLFIDIGSLDGTADYLAGVATVHPTIRVEVA